MSKVPVGARVLKTLLCASGSCDSHTYIPGTYNIVAAVLPTSQVTL